MKKLVRRLTSISISAFDYKENWSYRWGKKLLFVSLLATSALIILKSNYMPLTTAIVAVAFIMIWTGAEND
jgi:hypothetical protein